LKNEEGDKGENLSFEATSRKASAFLAFADGAFNCRWKPSINPCVPADSTFRWLTTVAALPPRTSLSRATQQLPFPNMEILFVAGSNNQDSSATSVSRRLTFLTDTKGEKG
jgi:hypothetical protein